MTSPAGSPFTILLVDDSLPLLEALQYLLYDESDLVVVGIAETGKRAIELATALSPDMVLLDVQLPDMAGYEVAQSVKALPQPPIVILISANGDQLSRERGLAAGGDGFIEKGSDWPQIIQQIRLILSKNI